VSSHARGLPRRRVLRIYHSGVVTAWRDRDVALTDEGIDVTLVTPRHWNEGGRDVDLVHRPDEHVVEARTWGRHPYRFVFDPRPLWTQLRHGHHEVIDIHEEPASLAVAEVLALDWLATRRRGRRPVCLYSAQNIAKRYPIPFRWLERLALRRAAAVHTCNDRAGEILRNKGFDGIVENLGLGVDPGAFTADHGTARRSGRFRVGFVGRLEPHKGLSVLVDAVATLPQVELDIVGDGPERLALEGRITEAGLTDRVQLTGFRAAEQIATVYSEFDTLAVPSLDTPGWVEQFGRVAVEAMAAGVPVVASRSGSLAEVVGDAGILVAPGDATALAEALSTLAADPGERNRLSRISRARAERWSWPAIARRQAALYRRICPEPAVDRVGG
jgi:glycosyltransferase involved in cell wall biosynthesis